MKSITFTSRPAKHIATKSVAILLSLSLLIGVGFVPTASAAVEAKPSTEAFSHALFIPAQNNLEGKALVLKHDSDPSSYLQFLTGPTMVFYVKLENKTFEGFVTAEEVQTLRLANALDAVGLIFHPSSDLLIQIATGEVLLSENINPELVVFNTELLESVINESPNIETTFSAYLILNRLVQGGVLEAHFSTRFNALTSGLLGRGMVGHAVFDAKDEEAEAASLKYTLQYKGAKTEKDKQAALDGLADSLEKSAVVDGLVNDLDYLHVSNTLKIQTTIKEVTGKLLRDELSPYEMDRYKDKLDALYQERREIKGQGEKAKDMYDKINESGNILDKLKEEIRAALDVVEREKANLSEIERNKKASALEIAEYKLGAVQRMEAEVKRLKALEREAEKAERIWVKNNKDLKNQVDEVAQLREDHEDESSIFDRADDHITFQGDTVSRIENFDNNGAIGFGSGGGFDSGSDGYDGRFDDYDGAVRFGGQAFQDLSYNQKVQIAAFLDDAGVDSIDDLTEDQLAEIEQLLNQINTLFNSADNEGDEMIKGEQDLGDKVNNAGKDKFIDPETGEEVDANDIADELASLLMDSQYYSDPAMYGGGMENEWEQTQIANLGDASYYIRQFINGGSDSEYYRGELARLISDNPDIMGDMESYFTGIDWTTFSQDLSEGKIDSSFFIDGLDSFDEHVNQMSIDFESSYGSMDEEMTEREDRINYLYALIDRVGIELSDEQLNSLNPGYYATSHTDGLQEEQFMSESEYKQTTDGYEARIQVAATAYQLSVDLIQGKNDAIKELRKQLADVDRSDLALASEQVKNLENALKAATAERQKLLIDSHLKRGLLGLARNEQASFRWRVNAEGVQIISDEEMNARENGDGTGTDPATGLPPIDGGPDGIDPATGESYSASTDDYTNQMTRDLAVQEISSRSGDLAGSKDNLKMAEDRLAGLEEELKTATDEQTRQDLQYAISMAKEEVSAAKDSVMVDVGMFVSMIETNDMDPAEIIANPEVYGLTPEAAELVRLHLIREGKAENFDEFGLSDQLPESVEADPDGLSADESLDTTTIDTDTTTIDSPADSTGTETTTAADGTITETTTDADGGVTEIVTSSDGIVTETITSSDGTVTETVTSADGLETIVTVINIDNSETITVITTNPDNNSETTTVTETNSGGVVATTVTQTETDSSGNTITAVETTTTDAKGAVTGTTTTQTTNNSKGETTIKKTITDSKGGSTTTETTKDKKGAVTGTTTTQTTNNSKAVKKADEKAGDKKTAVKPADKKTADKPADKKDEKPGDKKTAVKPADKQDEKAGDKKTADKPADKQDEKAGDKKTADKPADKKADEKAGDKKTVDKAGDKKTSIPSVTRGGAAVPKVPTKKTTKKQLPGPGSSVSTVSTTTGPNADNSNPNGGMTVSPIVGSEKTKITKLLSDPENIIRSEYAMSEHVINLTQQPYAPLPLVRAVFSYGGKELYAYEENGKRYAYIKGVAVDEIILNECTITGPMVCVEKREPDPEKQAEIGMLLGSVLEVCSAPA